MSWAMPLERLSSPDVRLLVSMSGGKDSTATALHMRELGLDFEAVFADTGWESDLTYQYLDEVLEPRFGPIRRVVAKVELPEELEADAERIEGLLGRSSPMVRRVLRALTFPRRTIRWCTSDLKLAPLRAYHQELAARGNTVVSAVGVRADESEKRAHMPVWELGDAIDAIVWRPILDWTVDDVIATLRRHGVPPNPLYLMGADRVGCFPCIHASKSEYLLLAGDTRRVEALRELERVVGDRWAARTKTKAKGSTLAGRGHRRPTWHYGWPKGNGPLPMMPPIDDVLLWARSQRQSTQTTMFREHELASAACARWGACEGEVRP